MQWYETSDITLLCYKYPHAGLKIEFLLIPLVLLILEIGKNTSQILGFSKGYNGVVFITMSIFTFSFLTNINKRDKVYTPIDVRILMYLLLILTFYLFFRLDFSNDIVFNIVTRFGNFVIVLLMFFVGFRLGGDIQNFYILNRFLIFTVFYSVIITFIFSLLGFGPSAYKGGIIHGPTQFQLYVAVIPIILSPLLNFLNKVKDNRYRVKSVYLKFAVVGSYIIVALSLMRTTWLMAMILSLCQTRQMN